MSPNDYPALTSKPRYLTGDKAGLKEFLDKFDVRLFFYFLLNAIIRFLLCNWKT